VKPETDKVDKRELEMALQLIDRFTGDFDPAKYEDTYRDTLCKIIRAKARGEKVHVEALPEPEEPTDLMAALRASLEEAQKRRGGKRAAGDGFERMSKDELYELAKRSDIPGRSGMSKEELIEALQRAA
jgi:DNA end-binding protein Ku